MYIYIYIHTHLTTITISISVIISISSCCYNYSVAEDETTQWSKRENSEHTKQSALRQAMMLGLT